MTGDTIKHGLVGDSAATMTKPFLVFPSDEAPSNDKTDDINDNGVPIYFQEDWDTGIGGGLWSTGLAFAQYLTTPHAATTLQQLAEQHRNTRSQQQQLPPPEEEGLSVLELGSGNSFLSVCLLGLAEKLEQQQQQQQQQQLGHSSSTFKPKITRIIRDLVITDLADHLPLMQKTLDANAHVLFSSDGRPKRRVCVMEHRWGEFLSSTTTTNNDNTGSGGSSSTDEESLFQAQVQQGHHKFDLILGSDVAYRPDLFDILISSLAQYSHESTIILLGVTMLDTNPTFFHKLRAAGFHYTKFADHLLEPKFRGPTFGIFCLQRQKKGATIV